MLSYETYALVRDVVRAHPLDPIRVKGISREVVPYVLDGLLSDRAPTVFSQRSDGIELFLDVDAITDRKAVRTLLSDALRALDRDDDA